MAFFKRERKLRPVAAGDLGYATILASLTTAPGPAREAEAQRLAAAMEQPSDARPVEYYVYDGEDGRPAAIASLTPLAGADDGIVEVWLGVDPALRSFGLGERVWDLVLARARKLKATRLRSHATQNEGLAFLSGHGFEATHTEGGDGGPYRVEAERSM